MIFFLIAAAIIGIFVVNWLLLLNAEPGTDKHAERSIATYLTGGFILFWVIWFFRLCLDWTDHVPADQLYAVRNHRIFSTLLIVVCSLFFPRIIRGTRRIWARNRTRPPISWWCALPYGCGWELLMNRMNISCSLVVARISAGKASSMRRRPVCGFTASQIAFRAWLASGSMCQ